MMHALIPGLFCAIMDGSMLLISRNTIQLFLPDHCTDRNGGVHGKDQNCTS